MKDKELYKKKMQAQLDEWSAEVDKFKARASKLSAETQLKMNHQMQILKSNIQEGKKKLSHLDEASDDTWESIKHGVETTWDSLKVAVNDFVTKFKEK